MCVTKQAKLRWNLLVPAERRRLTDLSQLVCPLTFVNYTLLFHIRSSGLSAVARGRGRGWGWGGLLRGSKHTNIIVRGSVPHRLGAKPLRPHRTVIILHPKGRMQPSLVLIRPVSAPLRLGGGVGGASLGVQPRLLPRPWEELINQPKNRAENFRLPSMDVDKSGRGFTWQDVSGPKRSFWRRRRSLKIVLAPFLQMSLAAPPKAADQSGLPPPPVYFIYELQAKMLLYIINSMLLFWLRPRATDVGVGVITFWPGSHPFPPFPFKNLQES